MKLVTPTADLHASWLAVNAEWGGEHQDGAATHLARGLDLTDPVDFATWVEMLNDDSVSATNHWMVEDGEYLGAIQLRHTIGSPALADLFGHMVTGCAPQRGAVAWRGRPCARCSRTPGKSVCIGCWCAAGKTTRRR